MVQLWSGAEAILTKTLSKRVISLLQLRYLLMLIQEALPAEKQAVRTEKIQTYSKSPSLPMSPDRKSLMRSEKCQTLMQLVAIFSTSSSLQVGRIQLMFWLKQQSISCSEAALPKNRNVPSTASNKLGKASRLVTFMFRPAKLNWMPRKSRLPPTAAARPSNLPLYSRQVSLLSKDQLLSRLSFSALTLNKALRSMLPPMYITHQMLRSNIFQVSSLRMRMTMARWKRGECSRALRPGSLLRRQIRKCFSRSSCMSLQLRREARARIVSQSQVIGGSWRIRRVRLASGRGTARILGTGPTFKNNNTASMEQQQRRGNTYRRRNKKEDLQLSIRSSILILLKMIAITSTVRQQNAKPFGVSFNQKAQKGQKDLQRVKYKNLIILKISALGITCCKSLFLILAKSQLSLSMAWLYLELTSSNF